MSGSGDVFQCQHQYLGGNGDVGWGSDGGGSGSSSGGGGGIYVQWTDGPID